MAGAKKNILSDDQECIEIKDDPERFGVEKKGVGRAGGRTWGGGGLLIGCKEIRSKSNTLAGGKYWESFVRRGSCEGLEKPTAFVWESFTFHENLRKGDIDLIQCEKKRLKIRSNEPIQRKDEMEISRKENCQL